MMISEKAKYHFFHIDRLSEKDNSLRSFNSLKQFLRAGQKCASLYFAMFISSELTNSKNWPLYSAFYK